METQDIPADHVSDWQPITEKYILAVLGKLGEETNELGAIISRCIIQGLDEREPVTGKLNREALQNEIADVRALTTLAIKWLDLDQPAIQKRIDAKMKFKAPWFRSLYDKRT